MTKKSLFIGTAALALLVLLSLVGCSNPSSGESTTYVSQAASDYPYPADTVFVDQWSALTGLLNDWDAPTNHVQHIAYSGTISGELEIPRGKVVYLNSAGTITLATFNIIVNEGAKLVLVSEFETSGTPPPGPGKVLVHGTVEVFRGLTVGYNALDVADYTVEDGKVIGRNTVIGKSVTILPGAYLALAGGGTVSDIIPPDQNSPNKFTPAQAWAAAGQGHLVIGNNSSVGDPDPADALDAYSYTVKELLTGVNPTATRSYTVTSGRFTSEVLPDKIPLGAYIRTSAVPTTSVGNKLLVEGTLITTGTLEDITDIEVGNGGALWLTEPDRELLQGLTNLKLGPGATLAVDDPITPTLNDKVSFESLATLFLGDGSQISVNNGGHSVTFKENTPLALTLGKNVTYRVGTSNSAAVNTVISKDASLVNGSTLIVYPGSTFTVEEGATFRVEGTAGSPPKISTFNITNLTAVTGQEPLVTINGTIDVGSFGSFLAPSSADAAVTNPENLSKVITLGPSGKILLNNKTVATDTAATFKFGNDVFVGAASSTYVWGTTDDGGQIELNAQGITIRDINGIDTSTAVKEDASRVTVTVGAPGAVILKGQSLFLDRGVTLQADATIPIRFYGGAEADGGGAKLLGPGRLRAVPVTAGGGTPAEKNIAPGTEIIGGDDGWQVDGLNNIEITAAATNTLTLKAFANPVPPAVAVEAVATFQAQGLGATINVLGSHKLVLAKKAVIDLNGSVTRKAGEITLASGGIIGFADDTDTKILTGAGPASHTAPTVPMDNASDATSSQVTKIAVANMAFVNLTGATTAVADGAKVRPGRLVSLVGTGTAGTATASAAISISSDTVTAPKP